MTRYSAAGHPADPRRAGVLVTNLGSPDAPTAPALRRYLREFLSDPRVIELPRPLWWLILNAFVLPFRPRRSAALYAKVWTAEGAPLIAIARRQVAGLRQRLETLYGEDVPVALGMRYGNPSIAAGLEELRAQGCGRVLVLPLYPQYSAATTGSTFDALAAALTGYRHVPELRMVGSYATDAGYIAALATSVREAWATEPPAERLLLSFHGLPVRYSRAGDPYCGECRSTARLLENALALAPGRLHVAFQSRFGREEWLTPYTDATLSEWARSGVESVDVICPGFSADCLETLEEIAMLNRDIFLSAGGRRYRYVPALNDRADHLGALTALAARHLAGWLAAGAPEPSRA